MVLLLLPLIILIQIEMLATRLLVRFCRTKDYINRFTTLESEVNRIEAEII